VSAENEFSAPFGMVRRSFMLVVSIRVRDFTNWFVIVGAQDCQ
jgi:hypothetical protein